MATARTASVLFAALTVASYSGLIRAQAPTSSAPAPASSRPVPPGFSAARLARVDQMLQSYVDDGLIPGAVALVLRDGRPASQKAVG